MCGSLTAGNCCYLLFKWQNFTVNPPATKSSFSSQRLPLGSGKEPRMGMSVGTIVCLWASVHLCNCQSFAQHSKGFSGQSNSREMEGHYLKADRVPPMRQVLRLTRIHSSVGEMPLRWDQWFRAHMKALWPRERGRCGQGWAHKGWTGS